MEYLVVALFVSAGIILESVRQPQIRAFGSVVLFAGGVILGYYSR
jgi:hypothetical protein